MITYMKSPAKDPKRNRLKSELRSDYTSEELQQSESIEIAFAAARYKRELAQTIKTKRAKMGISQRKLAELVGISQRDVSHIEQGKSNPTLSTQVKILSTLGLKLEIKSK